MYDIKISQDGVEKLLHRIDPSKASGPDEVTARVLKTTAGQIAPILRAIFQQSLDTGDIYHVTGCRQISRHYSKKQTAQRPKIIDQYLSPLSHVNYWNM
jgi:hypothetical protein